MADLQPDILIVMKDLLLSFTDVTDYVAQRVFLLQVPQNYSGQDCIVLTESPNTGADISSPITRLSVQIACFSKSKQTSRDINRIGIFPNLKDHDSFVDNDGSESFGDNYHIEITQSQSAITIQDTDFTPELWQTITEYDISLRY